MARYIDNTGKTKDEAVIILDAEDSGDAIVMEKKWLSEKFGERDVDWIMTRQQLIQPDFFNPNPDFRTFDLLTVELKNGEVLEIYYDITSVFKRKIKKGRQKNKKKKN